MPGVSDQLPGGLADGKPDDLFDSEQIQEGIQVEREHTDDPALAKEISKDHLVEVPDYYNLLELIEDPKFQPILRELAKLQQWNKKSEEESKLEKISCGLKRIAKGIKGFDIKKNV